MSGGKLKNFLFPNNEHNETTGGEGTSTSHVPPEYTIAGSPPVELLPEPYPSVITKPGDHNYSRADNWQQLLLQLKDVPYPNWAVQMGYSLSLRLNKPAPVGGDATEVHYVVEWERRLDKINHTSKWPIVTGGTGYPEDPLHVSLECATRPNSILVGQPADSRPYFGRASIGGDGEQDVDSAVYMPDGYVYSLKRDSTIPATVLGRSKLVGDSAELDWEPLVNLPMLKHTNVMQVLDTIIITFAPSNNSVVYDTLTGNHANLTSFQFQMFLGAYVNDILNLAAGAGYPSDVGVSSEVPTTAARTGANEVKVFIPKVSVNTNGAATYTVQEIYTIEFDSQSYNLQSVQVGIYNPYQSVAYEVELAMREVITQRWRNIVVGLANDKATTKRDSTTGDGLSYVDAYDHLGNLTAQVIVDFNAQELQWIWEGSPKVAPLTYIAEGSNTLIFIPEQAALLEEGLPVLTVIADDWFTLLRLDTGEYLHIPMLDSGDNMLKFIGLSDAGKILLRSKGELQ